MDYASQLANLDLSSLEYCRVYFDLAMCYKILKKLLNISSNVHSIKEMLYRHDFQLYFFTSWVVPFWNSLPQHVVSAYNIITFMSRLKTVDLSLYCKLYPFI